MKAPHPENAIPNNIGRIVSLCIKLTIPDIEAPKIIWIKPIIALALPAFLSKGASAIAVVFGTKSPNENKNVTSIAIKIGNVITLIE